jgi:hypothetical protein
MEGRAMPVLFWLRYVSPILLTDNSFFRIVAE